MLRDITLGQYYPADSVIHKLDPRVKLMGTLIYILSLFFCGVCGVNFLDTPVKSAVFLYGKRVKGDCGINGNYGAV